MQIRNASEMMGRAEDRGDGARSVQLYPDPLSRDGLVALDLWEVEPGGSMPPTSHAEEHILYVVAGSGELSGGGDGTARNGSLPGAERSALAQEQRARDPTRAGDNSAPRALTEVSWSRGEQYTFGSKAGGARCSSDGGRGSG
jgi:hypothetical protein